MNKSVFTRVSLVSWCLFGWASDTFPVLISTFIFSTYFIAHVAPNKITGTYLWADAAAIAGIFIAISGPIVGSIADKGGHHKRWLAFFTCACIISTALLWFACPSPSCIHFTLITFIIAATSLELTLVFYNAYLPRLAIPGYVGRISGWGWGMGYLGGITALTVMLFITVLEKPSWLNTAHFEQMRIVGPLSALWFAVFSLPLFIFLPTTPSTSLTLRQTIVNGLQELHDTFNSLLQEKNILLFLVARMIYTDGLNTLFAFGGIFAAGTFHFNLSQLLLFGISLNIMAGIGAIAFSWVDDYIGSKPTIILSLCFLLLLSGILLFLYSRFWFWLTACLLAIFVGPTQASSRSLMTRLTPASKASEFFGFYAMTGRITAFMGPWLLGLATFFFQSQRAGMATILLFFCLGLVLMLWVDAKKEKG